MKGDEGNQQREFADLAKPQPRVPSQLAPLAETQQQGAEHQRLHTQGQRGENHRRPDELAEQVDIELRPKREKEQDQKEIPQRFEPVGKIERNRARRQADSGGESPHFGGQPKHRRGFRDPQAPADGEQEQVFAELVVARDQRHDDEARHPPGEQQQRRKGEQGAQHRGLLQGPLVEKDEQENRDEILQQQDAHHEFPHVALVQHRGRQQLDADDGARKNHRETDHQAVLD